MIIAHRQNVRSLPYMPTKPTETIAMAELKTTCLAVLERVRPMLAHEGPADRCWAATALVPELTLVTSDARLLGSTTYAVLEH